VTPEELSTHLDAHRAALSGFVRRHAGVCLRHETGEDLVQGIHLQAIAQAERFEYRSAPEFEAWVFRIARGHMSDRRDYWTAAKRSPERLLRLTRPDGGAPAPGSAREPAMHTAGPVTRADRADRLRLADEALTMLLPRDAELVRGQADGLTLDEEAERLEISYAAAQRARLRALERYRKAFLLLARSQ
jgi:RNA polymerase sigma factor (sigma-70 family)